MNEPVSFFHVPLVCEAVASIGCGCRAKPILAQLERAPEIRRVWLHEHGDLLAVEWEDPPAAEQQLQRVQAAFASPARVSAAGSNTPLVTSFPDPGEWYRHDTVDTLSAQEASTIAARVLHRLRRQAVALPAGAQLQADLECALREVLVSDIPMPIEVRRSELVRAARDVLLRHLGPEAMPQLEGTLTESVMFREDDEPGECCA